MQAMLVRWPALPGSEGLASYVCMAAPFQQAAAAAVGCYAAAMIPKVAEVTLCHKVCPIAGSKTIY
jgi:hypothetical protein